ncbi:hypothetical protein DIPPA_21461 [Diplonema papillatum]|nr:hypothetical protein DIPPA_21461 [Diplonema papillatum]|eukprot:gene20768-32004_t
MSARDYARGVIVNAVGIGSLAGLAELLSLKPYCALALGLQYAVYLVHGLPYKSEKYYDLSGSATHLALVVASLMQGRALSARQVLTSTASTVWLSRLGSFLFLRISRDGRDERFGPFKKNALRFLSVWTIQALWVILTQLPVLLGNEAQDDKPLDAVDGAVFTAWSVGFVIEALADVQKFVFRCDPANKEKFITTGLWKYSQQPNYFGEILMWASLAFSTARVVGGGKGMAAWLSPAFACLLLLKVSGLPLVKAAASKKWGSNPAYQHYVKNTSVVVPWFPAPKFRSE